MRDVGRSASIDALSGTSSLVAAPDEVFGTHRSGLGWVVCLAAGTKRLDLVYQIRAGILA